MDQAKEDSQSTSCSPNPGVEYHELPDPVERGCFAAIYGGILFGVPLTLPDFAPHYRLGRIGLILLAAASSCLVVLWPYATPLRFRRRFAVFWTFTVAIGPFMTAVAAGASLILLGLWASVLRHIPGGIGLAMLLLLLLYDGLSLEFRICRLILILLASVPLYVISTGAIIALVLVLDRAAVSEAMTQTAYSRVELEQALWVWPRNHRAQNDLAWVLATHPDDSQRDASRAIRYATAACKATDFRSPDYLDTLAAAYAEAGDFREAVKLTRKAMSLVDPAESQDSKDFSEQMSERLQLYQQAKPFREPPNNN